MNMKFVRGPRTRAAWVQAAMWACVGLIVLLQSLLA
jgi:hypothetical protein